MSIPALYRLKILMNQQALTLAGPLGTIEAVLHPTDSPVTNIGIVCHPDPKQLGSMDNKVVTTVARAFQGMGITTVRFNYRGIGASEGVYGNITGEVDDCLAVVRWAQQQWPDAKLWLAGFSFGAYIAAKVATEVSAHQLITIAPSVERMPYITLPKVDCPWLVIQGDEDDVVSPQAVYQWYEQLDAKKTLIKFPATGHFFHGKLMELRQTITGLSAE